MIKKIISTLISMAMCMLYVLPISADSNYSDSPNEVAGETVSATAYFKVMDNGQLLELNPNSRTISTADLTLEMFGTPYKSGGKLSRIAIYFHYKWKKLPFNRLQDPMAIAWDTANLRLGSETFEKFDYYKQGGSTFTHSHNTRASSYNSYGFEWDADLPGQHLLANEMWGWGGGSIYPKKTMTSGNVYFYGKYVHLFVGGSAGFSYNGSGITVTNPSKCDTAGLQINVKF